MRLLTAFVPLSWQRRRVIDDERHAFPSCLQANITRHRRATPISLLAYAITAATSFSATMPLDRHAMPRFRARTPAIMLTPITSPGMIFPRPGQEYFSSAHQLRAVYLLSSFLDAASSPSLSLSNSSGPRCTFRRSIMDAASIIDDARQIDGQKHFAFITESGFLLLDTSSPKVN